MGANSLTSSDYVQLAQIMAGPHGQKVTSDAPVDLLVVFACADAAVGRAAAQLYADGLVRRVVISGRVGKDSGGLPALGITEAVFLASVAIADGLPTEVILLEQEAGNGKENAEFSLRLATEQGLLHEGSRVAGLAPAERCRRLYEELRYRAATSHPEVNVVAGFSSGAVDPDEPEVREELVRELRGLHTMHAGESPRIMPQADFQDGGAYYDLVVRAGLVD